MIVLVLLMHLSDSHTAQNAEELGEQVAATNCTTGVKVVAIGIERHAVYFCLRIDDYLDHFNEGLFYFPYHHHLFELL